LNIALNKVSGDWGVPLLTDLLKDLDDSGFDLAEINELFGEPDAVNFHIISDWFNHNKTDRNVRKSVKNMVS